MADDLSWDFTGDSIDEESPFLIYGFKNPGDPRCTISRQQMEYIVKNLEDSANILGDYLRMGKKQTRSPEQAKTGCWSKIHIPAFVVDNLLIITVVLQALNITALSIVDLVTQSSKTVTTVINVGSGIMITLEILNLLLVIITSAKLTKQLVSHNVNSIFLAQSYLASVLLFAGIYTVTYRLDHKSWKFLGEVDNTNDPAILIVEVFLKMVFLSVSTATLCGSSSMGPKEWYNYLFMSLQMLLSFVYFTSILSKAMGDWSNAKHTSREDQHDGGLISGRTSRMSQRTSRSSIGMMSGRSSRNSILMQSGRTSRNSLNYGSIENSLILSSSYNPLLQSSNNNIDPMEYTNISSIEDDQTQTNENVMLLTES